MGSTARSAEERESILAAATGVTQDPGRVELLAGPRGGIFNDADNVVRALSDPEMAGRISWCELSHRPMYDNRPMRDADYVAIHRWLVSAYGFHAALGAIREAVGYVADANPTHPVRDYLLGLEWDGVPRIDQLCCRYLGCVDMPIYRKYSTWWMIGAAHRAIEPGCKQDYALVLFSAKQGSQKSTAASVLAVKREWFSDQTMPWDNPQQCAELVEGVWIKELQELAGVTKADREDLKSQISRQVDRVRKPYMHLQGYYPRSCVFIGSTNERQAFSDPTGLRRFWVAEVERSADIMALERDRDQLWAEAVHRYQAGERHWPLPEEEEELAAEAQEWKLEDIWEEAILGWASRQTAPFSRQDVAEGALGLEANQMSALVSKRIGDILVGAGYQNKVRRDKKGLQRRWWKDVPKSTGPALIRVVEEEPPLEEVKAKTVRLPGYFGSDDDGFPEGF